MDKNKRPHSDGFVFHGGCLGCNLDISKCHGCLYLDYDERVGRFPNLNPESVTKEKERERMKELALSMAPDKPTLKLVSKTKKGVE